MAKKAKKVPFDSKVFLATVNGGRSYYCIAAHSAALRNLTRDPAPADAVETLGR